MALTTFNVWLAGLKTGAAQGPFADDNLDLASPTGGIATHDITGDVIGRCTIERGRDQIRAFGPPMVGRSEITVDNAALAYSPENGSSAYAGLIIPGNAIQIDATHSGTTRTIFRGSIGDVALSPAARTVTLTCQSLMAEVVKRSSVTRRVAGISSWAEVIDDLLDAIGWPTAAGWRTFDGGSTQIHEFFCVGRSLLELLSELVTVEGPGARIDVAGDGGLIVHGRYRAITDTTWQTSQATFGDGGSLPHIGEPFTYGPRWENIANDVTVQGYSVRVDPTQIIYEDAGPLASGTAQIITIYLDAPTPIASTTEIAVSFEETAGNVSGVDKFLTGRTRVKVEIYSLSGPFTITDLRVTAPVVLAEAAGDAVTASDSTSINTYGRRSLTIDSQYIDANAAELVAERYLAAYKDPPAQVTFAVDGTNDTHRAQQLDRALGDLITIVETDSTINETYTVEQIRHDVEGPGHQTVFAAERRAAPVVAYDEQFIFDHATQGKFDTGKFGA